MAKILVAYSTVEGQTRKVATFIADHLTRRRNKVKLLDLTAGDSDVDPADFDAVVVASSVHMRRHNAPAIRFASRHADVLTKMPSAFVSVSLHAMSSDPEDEEEARDYVDSFCKETKWLPRAVAYVAGALRFTEYDFFKRWAAFQVAKERGLSPKKEGDLELTDWHALTAFLETFLKEHVPGG